MSRVKYDYPGWSDEALLERVKLYQNSRGRLDIRKVYGPASTDTAFLISGSIVAAVFLAIWGIFNLLELAWSPNHYIMLSIVEFYPVAALLLIGLDAIGTRVDEVRFYYTCKRLLRERGRLESGGYADA